MGLETEAQIHHRMGKLAQRNIDGLLGPADRPHGTFGQSAGQPINLLIELIGRHDVVDQPDALGLRRGHQIAGEQVLLGAREADQLRPEQRPAVATRPALTCGSPILAWSAAMMMSQRSAIIAPSPTAWPLTRAMIGLSHSSMRNTIRLASGMPVFHASGSSIFCCMAITFPPAENARPAPVRMTTLTSGSSFTSSQMRDIEVCIGPVNALRVSGEFKVMVSTLSSRLTSTPPYWE